MWFSKYPMKVLKWDKNFSTQKELSLAPVWVRLPNPPLSLFNKQALAKIAQVAGKPLSIDEHTTNRSKPNYGKICIKMDVLKEKPDMIVLQVGDQEVNQKIFYESIHKYCSHCHHIGHNVQECYCLRKEEDKNFLFQKRMQEIKMGKRPVTTKGQFDAVDTIGPSNAVAKANRQDEEMNNQ